MYNYISAICMYNMLNNNFAISYIKYCITYNVDGESDDFEDVGAAALD